MSANPAYGPHKLKETLVNRLLGGLVLLGCLTASSVVCASPGKKTNPKETTVTTKSGLKYIDVVVGKGKSPTTGQTVSVDYTGRFTDGKIFDSSKGKRPLEFVLGAHRVIPGWEEAIATMKVGGKRKLTNPAEPGIRRRGLSGRHTAERHPALRSRAGWDQIV